MALPSSINLTTADQDGDQAAGGWSSHPPSLVEAVIGGTFGGATVTLQSYDTANSAWVSTSNTWTAEAAVQLNISSCPHRFYLTTAGSGADVDITLYTIRTYKA